MSEGGVIVTAIINRKLRIMGEIKLRRRGHLGAIPGFQVLHFAYPPGICRLQRTSHVPDQRATTAQPCSSVSRGIYLPRP